MVVVRDGWRKSRRRSVMTLDVGCAGGGSGWVGGG